jgi:hypothetical protein
MCRRVTVSVYVPVVLMGSGTFANKSGFRNVVNVKVIEQGSNVVSYCVILLGDWSFDCLFPLFLTGHNLAFYLSLRHCSIPAGKTIFIFFTTPTPAVWLVQPPGLFLLL